jgi:hypothetical protein
LRSTICQVVPFWGFQIDDMRVLFGVVIAGVCNGELGFGGDEDEEGSFRKRRPRGTATAVPMSMPRMTIRDIRLHARFEISALKVGRFSICSRRESQLVLFVRLPRCDEGIGVLNVEDAAALPGLCSLHFEKLDRKRMV